MLKKYFLLILMQIKVIFLLKFPKLMLLELELMLSEMTPFLLLLSSFFVLILLYNLYTNNTFVNEDFCPLCTWVGHRKGLSCSFHL